MIGKVLAINLFALLLSGLFNVSFAQEALKLRPSPLEMVTFKYEDTYIKVTYSRPHKRGREVFGNPDLVPYDSVWRTGANEATEITTTKAIEIAGQKLEAGTYSLFSIPRKDSWTIILNSDVGQWGAYKYNSEFDVLRFDVPSTQIETVYEPFTIEFEQGKKNVSMVMMWDQTRISIPIEFL